MSLAGRMRNNSMSDLDDFPTSPFRAGTKYKSKNQTGSAVYTAFLVASAGLACLLIAAITWYAGAYFTLEFVKNAVKSFSRQELFGWWVWAIPVIISVIEVGMLKFIGNDLELKAVFCATLFIDAATTTAGAYQWFDNAQLMGGLPVYLVLGFVVGVGFAIVPEVLLRKAGSLLILAFGLLKNLGG